MKAATKAKILKLRPFIRPVLLCATPIVLGTTTLSETALGNYSFLCGSICVFLFTVFGSMSVGRTVYYESSKHPWMQSISYCKLLAILFVLALALLIGSAMLPSFTGWQWLHMALIWAVVIPTPVAIGFLGAIALLEETDSWKTAKRLKASNLPKRPSSR